MGRPPLPASDWIEGESLYARRKRKAAATALLHQSRLQEPKKNPPQFGQASRIILRFGGAKALARIMEANPASIYKWTYPHPKGSDGLVPVAHVGTLLELARAYGVTLTQEDWDPTTPYQPPPRKERKSKKIAKPRLSLKERK